MRPVWSATAHAAVRGSSRDAARVARRILDRNDSPSTGHQVAADTALPGLPDLVEQLMNRRSATLSRRRAAHHAWHSATAGQPQPADRSHARDRSRELALSFEHSEPATTTGLECARQSPTPLRLPVRFGEFLAGSQGVGVIGAQHPLPVADGTLQLRDGLVEAPRLLVAIARVWRAPRVMTMTSNW
jgi:hypothetical protein